MLSDNYEIEFDESTHSYLINGVIVQSVTQLLKKKFNSMYAGVPKRVLEASATLGTNVHKAIECDSKGIEIPKLSIYEQLCFEQYLELKNDHHINAIESEMIVHYKDKYCGCIDGIFDIDYGRCLVDVKCTSILHREYLEYQLGLYAFALKEMGYNQKFDKFYCLHLPKGDIGRLVEIRQLKEKEIIEFLKENELYE